MAKLKINLDFSLKRLDLVVKGLVTTKFLGNYPSAFKGQGLEFADYRRYTEGVDDANLIDWKASKRTNDLLVKEYVEERNIEIVFVIDVSHKMLVSSTKKLKAEYIAELVASFGYSMLKAGDSVGIILFSDKIIKFIPPQSGLKQFYSLTENLSNTKNYGGYSDVDKALDFAFKNVSKDSIVILVSDFIYPTISERMLRINARKFDLILMMVRDARDVSLPEGIGEILVSEPYSEDVMLIEPNKIRKEYSRETYSEISKIKGFTTKVGADFLILETDKPFIKPLTAFFKSREAKWR